MTAADTSKRLSDIVACVACRGELVEEGSRLRCAGCGAVYDAADGIPVMLELEKMSPSERLSLQKWNDYYTVCDLRAQIDEYARVYEKDFTKLFDRLGLLADASRKVLLEVGCGASPSGLYLAKRGYHYVGIDFSIEALKRARQIFREEGIDATFICGSIVNLPVRDALFDFLWAGGSLEHFQDVGGALTQWRRVLRPGGGLLATVPYLSLGTLLYRWVWGNIPDLFPLKQIAEFIHIKLLQGRHMIFGYELSFPAWKLRRYFRRSGYGDVLIGHLDVPLMFHFIPWRWLKKFCNKLGTLRLFWAMVYVFARKAS